MPPCRLLFAAALAVAAPFVTAQAKLPCTRPLKASLLDFGLMHSSATQTGIDDDLLAQLRERTGCRIEVLTVPINRALKMLAAGAIDLQFSAAWRADRAQYGYYAYYGALKNRLLIRTDHPVATPAQLAASHTFKLGQVRGGTYGDTYGRLAEQLRQHGRLFEASDVNQLFDWLARGRVDGILTVNVVYVPKLRALGLDDRVTAYDWAPDEAPLRGGVLISKHNFSEAEARAWQAIFDDMRKDGTMLRIYRKYLPEAEAQAFLHF